jgi:hypothetical protein
VVKFKYLGTAVTNQNYVHEEIKSRLNSGNASYHTVLKLLSSRLLSKNLNIKIYKTINLPVLREYLDLRVRKWREAGENCIMRSFVTYTLH